MSVIILDSPVGIFCFSCTDMSSFSIENMNLLCSFMFDDPKAAAAVTRMINSSSMLSNELVAFFNAFFDNYPRLSHAKFYAVSPEFAAGFTSQLGRECEFLSTSIQRIIYEHIAELTGCTKEQIDAATKAVCSCLYDDAYLDSLPRIPEDDPFEGTVPFDPEDCE